MPNSTPALGTQYNPLRLPKSHEEFEANYADTSRIDLGVTGTLFVAEEATVVISVGEEWHHMDVDYALRIYKMLGEVIVGAKKHNQKLAKKN
jgi:hypothetical protein